MNESQRHLRAEQLAADLSPEATNWLLDALSDPGILVAEAAAESLAGRAERHLQEVMDRARISTTAAYYVTRMAGVEALLELSTHPDEQIRAQALYSIRPQYLRCGDTRLVRRLQQMLIDPSSSVTYEYPSMRPTVLRSLIKLGPLAAELESRLDALHRKMAGRSDSDELQLLEKARQAIAGRSQA
ncbi:hypothetical protein JST97_29785 [bacterium]|nr:hypothetical protein [bacterium]